MQFAAGIETLLLQTAPLELFGGSESEPADNLFGAHFLSPSSDANDNNNSNNHGDNDNLLLFFKRGPALVRKLQLFACIPGEPLNRISGRREQQVAESLARVRAPSPAELWPVDFELPGPPFSAPSWSID